MRRALILLVGLVLVFAGIVFIERQQGFAEARLLQCLLIAVLAAILAWVSSGVVRNLFVSLSSVLVGIALLEGFAIATRPADEPAESIFSDAGLSRPRDVLGWGPSKPGDFHVTKVRMDGRVIYDTHVTIDADLNRKTTPSSGTRSVVFFGDSWIYGDGVNDTGTLPQAFADLNKGKIPVLNLSMAGWSPAQNLADLSISLFKPPVRSPRHFVLFTAPFHVERTACKGNYAFSTAPRYAIDSEVVKYVGPCVGQGGNFLLTVNRVIRRFALYERIFPYFNVVSKRDVETYIKIIKTFVTTAKRDHKVDTTLLFEPSQDAMVKGTGYTGEQIVEELRKSGVDVLVDNLPKIANDDLYWIPMDGHPSAFSNVARAKEIQAHLQAVDPEAIKPDDRAPP